MKATIMLSIDTPYGRFASALDVDEYTFSEKIALGDQPFPGSISFNDAVTVLKKRSFRKDLLRQTALRLATQIAERLEDKEGWHGEDRRESAIRQLPPSP